MTPTMPSEQKWPDRVEFYLCLDEHDDFLEGYLRLRHWTPFEAACLIRGYRPGTISHGIAKVGVILPHAIDQQSIDEFKPLDPTASDDLILLAREIVDHNKDATKVRAYDVIRWAQGREVIAPSSRLAQFFSSESHSDAAGATGRSTSPEPSEATAASKGTGKHHEEKRLAILGFVIQELAKNIPEGKIDRLEHGVELNSSGLASHVHRYRDSLGVPSEETSGFSFKAVEECIRKAVQAAKKYSTKKA